MNLFYATAAFLLIFAGLVAFVLALRGLFGNELSSRLKVYVEDEEQLYTPRETNRFSRRRELSGSLVSRTVLPIFRQIGNIFERFTPAKSIETLRHQLYIAGNPMGMGPREFYGIRVGFIFLGVWLGYMVYQRATIRFSTLIAVLVFVFCLVFPILWLRMMVSSRQNKIRKSLPDTLDLLSVCATAGLGFDQSMQRVSENMNTPVANELGRVVAEMEMGVSRREALRNLADRLDVSELSSFVAIIIQSEQLGMSISDTLHSQADQMRIERHYRAQEQARKAPIKMLIPLAFLIFPAIMAVLLGPSVPPLLELFSGF